VRCPSVALLEWQRTGAFGTLVPALDAAAPEAFQVVDHLARPGPATRPARRTLRFAGLLVTLGAPAATAVLTGLRSSRVEIQTVSTLLDRWQAIGGEIEDALTGLRAPGDGSVRRWVAAVGRLHVGPFMRLASAIWTARRANGKPAPSQAAIHSVYRRMQRSAFRDAVDLGSLAVDGDDLRRAGIPSGPGLGKILQSLLGTVIADPSRNAADWLLQEARRLQDGPQHDRG
ncbi:MAG: hypothetical protein ABI205_12390, partial [Gemmatimonadaceae bacterium]